LLAALLVFSLILSVFRLRREEFSRLLKLQYAPAAMRSMALAATLSVGSLIVLTVAAFFAGRFYCSLLCPLGTWQEIVALVPTKCSSGKDLRKTRLLIAGIVFGLLISSCNLGFLLLDPYSLFGRMVRSLSLSALVIFPVITILALWKKRFFCANICPVGTVLGLFAEKGYFLLQFNEACVKCGKCVKNCPAGCMDPAKGEIDNARCVRCLKCLSVCPAGGLSFSRKKLPPPPDETRRKFLAEGGVFVGGMILGRLGAFAAEKYGKKIVFPASGILPPGAGDLATFLRKCTACQLCTASCPEKIIRPAKGGTGPVSLVLGDGACNFDCRKCIEVCPAGALKNLTLTEKRNCKIAQAVHLPKNCIAFQDEETCGLCAAACPVNAIVLRKNGTPRPVKKDLCIGCGSCLKACPANPPAIRMEEIRKQIVMTKITLKKDTAAPPDNGGGEK
ncbi:MAG: 4Fe-4S binding protein, partial [Lentisphaeria bacterium]|nr:4Fe-4S binding protein [Lentisphaeria bacterium]